MIKFYTTGCPNCARLKKMLDERNVQYEIHADREEMIRLGMTSVPMLEVDGELIGFVDSVKWVRTQEAQE